MISNSDHHSIPEACHKLIGSSKTTHWQLALKPAIFFLDNGCALILDSQNHLLEQKFVYLKKVSDNPYRPNRARIHQTEKCKERE